MPTTWNPADKGVGVTLANNNLTALMDLFDAVRSTTSKTDGKWYFECFHNWVFTQEEGGHARAGILKASGSLNNPPGEDALGWGIYWRPGVSAYDLMNNGTDTVLTGPGADSDVLGICVDLDNLKLYATKNGTNLLGNPSALTGGQTIASGPWFAAVGGDYPVDGISAITTNFGATGFAFGPPAPFSAWDSTPFTYKPFSVSSVSITRTIHMMGV